MNSFDISAVVSCHLKEKKKPKKNQNSVEDGWLRTGRQEQKMYTKEKLRQLKEQIK